jgi:hypothetical protein
VSEVRAFGLIFVLERSALRGIAPTVCNCSGLVAGYRPGSGRKLLERERSPYDHLGHGLVVETLPGFDALPQTEEGWFVSPREPGSGPGAAILQDFLALQGAGSWETARSGSRG